MSLDLYKGFTNPVSGEFYRCTKNEVDCFTIDWIVQPNCHIPFEHIHINQEETFFVLEGELKVLIDDVFYFCKQGESITVPMGKSHIAYNNNISELLTCSIEYKPGLDSYQFFQCFGGLTEDKFLDKEGGISIPKMCYFTRKMKAKCITRPSTISAPVFSFAINLYYVIGMLFGWNKLYTKYTGNK